LSLRVALHIAEPSLAISLTLIVPMKSERREKEEEKKCGGGGSLKLVTLARIFV
jgi:hypothetical protein